MQIYSLDTQTSLTIRFTAT